MRGVAASGMVSAIEDLGLTGMFDTIHCAATGAYLAGEQLQTIARINLHPLIRGVHRLTQSAKKVSPDQQDQAVATHSPSLIAGLSRRIDRS